MKSKLLESIFEETYTEEEQKTATAVIKLLRVVSTLRHPEHGCPWDKEQTHESLRSYLIEETFEAVEAIDLKKPDLLKEELGDVLLQIALHAQLASEEKTFSFKDIADTISEKMIRRHPHVFSDTTAKNSEEVLKNWEQLKSKEKSESPDLKNKLSEKIKSIPKSLPALLFAERIGDKSARYSFDWNSLSEVQKKLQEEYQELEVELNQFIAANNPHTPLKANQTSQLNLKDIGGEIGDCLFTLTQTARWLGLSAEDLLRATHEKFLHRILSMEEELPADFLSSSRENIENAWNKAKTKE